MAKQSKLMQQIKKERLDKHLADVEGLIGDWITQLSATDPFAFRTSGDTWAWQSVYEPALEQDPDSNHMLRRHLRSRALWRHHCEWKEALGRICGLSASINTEAGRMVGQRPANRRSSKRRVPSEAYFRTALWQASCLTRNHTQEIDYTRGDNGKGVRFGGYLIETSAATEQDFQRICEEHLRLCYELSLLDRMKAAAKEWASVEDLQNKMQALSRKALKSSDFLYPCRFCRHLWRA